MPPGLHVHVADDLDVLADVAAAVLSQPAGAVLAPEWVVVPSAPVRQWLDWRLAERLGTAGADRHDGVAANMVNLFPEEFVRRVERAALASAGGVGWTSWDIDALTVRVLATTDRSLRVPEARALAQDIEDLVRWRPDVVRGQTPPTRAAEAVLRAYHRLAPPGDRPHDQRDRVAAALARGAIPALPARVVIYGLADVPGGPGFIELVRGVANSADVVVLLSAIEGATRTPDDRDDPRALAAWATESDDALRLWRTVAPDDSSWTFHPHLTREASVLAATGAALRGRHTPPAVTDTTVQVVGACGLDRQVEQVRDLIIDVASRDGLEPTDVLVASPDPGAVMDAIERHWLHHADDRDLPRLPADPTVVLTADRRSRLDVSLALLVTGRSRCTAADVRPLLSYPSVAETLGVDQRVRDRVGEIVDAAHLTLGLSPQHREPFAVYGPHGGLRPDAGSWQRLLDRVVATSLLGPDTAAAGVGVPDDLDVVTTLAPLLRTLDEVGAARAQTSPVATWLATLGAWVDAVAGGGPTLDASFDEAARRLRRALGEGEGPDLSLDDFADLWSIVTRESSRQRVFGRGGVTVTDLASLAYAPHRVVCLVGLDDHRLPAGAWPSAVMGERRLGDPDPRRSALAAVRAAIATARDTLIVTYTDRRLDDGRPLDPPVIVDELVEAVTAAAGVEASHLTRTTPRHAASVPEGVPGMIDVTWDPRAAGRDQAAIPTLAVAEVDVTRVSWRDLRTFANGPVAFFLRRSWRADLPTEPPDDVDVPPLTLPPLRRAEVQRAFVWEMVAALRERYGDSPPALPAAAFGHDECDEQCAWLHDLARAVAGALFADEARNANVPPRLWRHRVQLAPLTLAAYNLACDLAGWMATPDDELQTLAGGVTLATGTHVTTDVVREVPSPLALHSRGDELALVTLEARHGGASDWRRLLRSVVDVLVLTALAPQRPVVATTYFLPDKAEPYGRSNARYGSKEGHFRGNPRATLRVAPGADARALLERVVALFAQGCRAPIALFPETSVAAVATGIKRRAESEWRGRDGHGEADRVEHRLLYPLSASDVLGLDGGRLPYEDELTEILGAMEVEDLSQARRCHDGLGRAEAVPPQFAPLVERP